MLAVETSQFFVLLVSVVFFVWFIAYLVKLEKIGCECALTWKRQYIIAYLVISLLWKLLLIVTPQFPGKELASIVLLGLGLMFIIVTVTYVRELKQKKCECSNTVTREVLYVYAWLNVIAMLILFMLLLFVGLQMFSPKQQYYVPTQYAGRMR